ncbi:acyl carrier protein-like protein [Schizophyllum amplum]|uniref:Acyl carrier protein n=1 Tax=Schizophyllum amplum TaxID=97359 RepID=A0A550CN13_9AGAR|nr:acyl carrier protein-like protein [Auriculariopsis ampla]
MSFARAAFRSAAAAAARRPWTPAALPRARPMPAFPAFRIAPYSSGGSLSKETIQSRVFDVLKSSEKVDPAKLTPTASFSKDLGLDSLDAVEVVMSIEEEFGIEIPDAEADAIQTVDQGMPHILETLDTRLTIPQLSSTLSRPLRLHKRYGASMRTSRT